MKTGVNQSDNCLRSTKWLHRGRGRFWETYKSKHAGTNSRKGNM